MIEKLIAVQEALKAPKSQYNAFGKYNYRNAEDILEAVKPLLAEQGLLLMLSDAIVNIGDRYYVEATATITDGSTRYTCKASAREVDDKKGSDPSQITGAASSYARKYVLNGMFLIDDTKDADAQIPAQEPRKTAPKSRSQPQAPTAQQADILVPVRALFSQYVAALNVSPQTAVDMLCQQVGAQDMQSMTPKQVQKALEVIRVALNERAVTITED